MLDIIKRFFGPAESGDIAPSDPDRDLRVAVCALLVEMARIDEQFTKEEMTSILDILKDTYGLDREHADALVATADRELEESVDLWQFARRINENYAIEEKLKVIELMWRVVYVDGKMDAHEHYLMNKMKNLLRLSLDQLIEVKLAVKKELVG